MPPNWIDVSELSFNVLLLLEQVQLSWFPGWVPEIELGIALNANPVVQWYMRHKCPQINGWVDQVLAQAYDEPVVDTSKVRRAELTVMRSINDLLVYVLEPAIYDSQPFLNWDSNELLELANFRDQTVIDVGAGTGRLALTVAPHAACVFAVEPVANLRLNLRKKAGILGVKNVYSVDGLITQIPFPDGFADIVMGGHVFGDALEAEHRELMRVTKSGGTVILCPGNRDLDNQAHHFLVSAQFQWARFEEPGEGFVRKYWKKVV